MLNSTGRCVMREKLYQMKTKKVLKRKKRKGKPTDLVTSSYNALQQLYIDKCTKKKTTKPLVNVLLNLKENQVKIDLNVIDVEQVEIISDLLSLSDPKSASIQSITIFCSGGGNKPTKSSSRKKVAQEDRQTKIIVKNHKESLTKLFRGVSKACQHHSSLSDIIIYDLRFYLPMANLLGKGIKLSTSLRKLDIKNCKLMDKGLEAMWHSLKTSTSLEVLILNKCGLTDTSSRYVCDIIRFHNGLRDEDKWSCGLRGDESLPLSTLKRIHSKGLCVLELKNNDFTDKSAESFASAIGYDSWLLSVSIFNNHFTQQGLQYFIDALNSNITLLDLDAAREGDALEFLHHKSFANNNDNSGANLSSSSSRRSCCYEFAAIEELLEGRRIPATAPVSACEDVITGFANTSFNSIKKLRIVSEFLETLDGFTNKEQVFDIQSKLHHYASSLQEFNDGLLFNLYNNNDNTSHISSSVSSDVELRSKENQRNNYFSNSSVGGLQLTRIKGKKQEKKSLLRSQQINEKQDYVREVEISLDVAPVSIDIESDVVSLDYDFMREVDANGGHSNKDSDFSSPVDITIPSNSAVIQNDNNNDSNSNTRGNYKIFLANLNMEKEVRLNAERKVKVLQRENKMLKMRLISQPASSDSESSKTLPMKGDKFDFAALVPPSLEGIKRMEFMADMVLQLKKVFKTELKQLNEGVLKSNDSFPKSTATSLEKMPDSQLDIILHNLHRVLQRRNQSDSEIDEVEKIKLIKRLSLDAVNAGYSEYSIHLVDASLSYSSDSAIELGLGKMERENDGDCVVKLDPTSISLSKESSVERNAFEDVIDTITNVWTDVDETNTLSVNVKK